MENSFFNKINYSASNEDERSELRFFAPLDRPKIMCVTASGSRPLSLLLLNPKKVCAVDLNPTQNFLLELKIAAMKAFSHPEYLEFLGISGQADARRKDQYQRSLKSDLSPQAQNFWDQNLSLIQSGILYCGTWEKLQKTLAKPMAFFGLPILDLLDAKDLDDQRQIWQRRGRERLMRFLLKMNSQRWVWKYIFKEPGINFVPKNFDIFEYLDFRFSHALGQIYLHDSAFFELMWTGRYLRSLPVHLQAQNFELIKQRLDRIQICTDSVSGCLRNSTEAYDAFSLSDISSYSNSSQHLETWLDVANASNPGAHVLARHFLVKHPWTSHLADKFERNPDFEAALQASDDAAIYGFTAAVAKSS